MRCVSCNCVPVMALPQMSLPASARGIHAACKTQQKLSADVSDLDLLPPQLVMPGVAWH